MPTFERPQRFKNDWAKLSPEIQRAFKEAVRTFVADLPGPFSPSLRVKRVQGSGRGIFEMTFLPDGRATFEYGDPIRDGEPHIVWRRVGTHDIFRSP